MRVVKRKYRFQDGINTLAFVAWGLEVGGLSHPLWMKLGFAAGGAILLEFLLNYRVVRVSVPD